jgi:hypothetical protein
MNTKTKKILFALCGAGTALSIGVGASELIQVNHRADRLSDQAEQLGQLVASNRHEIRDLNDTVQNQEYVIQGQNGFIAGLQDQLAHPATEVVLNSVPTAATNPAVSTTCSVIGAVAGVGGAAVGAIGGASVGSVVPVAGTALGATLGGAALGAATRGAGSWVCNGLLGHF